MRPGLELELPESKSGLTLLMLAAAGGHAGLVAGLLQRRANPHKESPQGCTALTFAAECSLRAESSLECLRLLIAAGSDVNHRSSATSDRTYCKRYGAQNPVGNAVALLDHSEKMKLLLQNNAEDQFGGPRVRDFDGARLTGVYDHEVALPERSGVLQGSRNSPISDGQASSADLSSNI
jgi:ankyrin repeat protein